MPNLCAVIMPLHRLSLSDGTVGIKVGVLVGVAAVAAEAGTTWDGCLDNKVDVERAESSPQREVRRRQTQSHSKRGMWSIPCGT